MKATVVKKYELSMKIPKHSKEQKKFLMNFVYRVLKMISTRMKMFIWKIQFARLRQSLTMTAKIGE